jgi:hypothetical protein
MMIFSPAVGGRRKEDTTSSIVIKQGRIIAHLDIINNLCTRERPIAEGVGIFAIYTVDII